MFVHTMLVMAAEGAEHEPYKNHNEWYVGIVVMLIFILLLLGTMAFQKDK
jgi:ABC-type enterochelin transport system permease subunit